MTTTGIVLAAAAALIMGGTAHATPVSYTGGTYTQNFDSLPWTANGDIVGTWVNDSTLTGWHASGFTDFRGSDGNVAGNNTSLFSYSSNGLDKALGSQVGPAGGPGPTVVRWGVQLINNTGVTLTGFTASFAVEQWRDSGNLIPELMLFESRLNATSLDQSYFTERGIAYPVFSSSEPTALDGNLAANRVAVSVTVNRNWGAGESLWLRWVDVDDPRPRPDAAIALDDFRFSATPPIPEPSEWAMLLAGLFVVGMMARRRRQMRA
jgi:hypothetical protein